MFESREAGSAEEGDVGLVKVGEVTGVLRAAVIAQGGGGKGQQSPVGKGRI